MNKLYDAFEACLQAMERGVDLETALGRYPALADELRPLLEASLQARRMSAEPPSLDVLRRGRARLLQRASELREARRPARGSVIPLFQRFAIALTLTAVLLLSGTGLVSASSSALPGEKLYPVKRTWEDVRLLFIFDPRNREALEGEYEQERLEEVYDLIQEGHVVSITFSGVITGQQANQLAVSGVKVDISAQTQISGDPLSIGAAVLVTGRTQSNGIVAADSIMVLPPGSLVPAGESLQLDQETDEDRSSSGPGTGEQTGPSSSGTAPAQQPEEGGKNRSFHLEGTIDSIQGDIWIINGRTVYPQDPQIQGSVSVGSKVKIEGYFTSDGRFIVTKVEIEKSGSDDGKGSNGEDNGGGDDHGGGDDSGDDGGGGGDDGGGGGDD